jgi:hypothetical protein
VPTGIRPSLTKRLKDAGIQLPAELFERPVPARWS